MTKVICLDPGHGGYDPGAIGNGLREKDINLAVVLQLADILKGAGVDVVLTRDSDNSPGGYTNVNQDLTKRCQISNDANADLFFSIHVNAGGGNGAEIYVEGSGGDIHPLASQIVQNVGSLMGIHGEAIKNGSELFVIRNTQAPAMLLELGFIDSSDADKLKTNLNKFASLIAPPILTYLGVAPLEVQKPANDWQGTIYEKAVDFVKAAGLMEGYDPNHFGTNDNLTRGEFASVLQRLVGMIEKSSQPPAAEAAPSTPEETH